MATSAPERPREKAPPANSGPHHSHRPPPRRRLGTPPRGGRQLLFVFDGGSITDAGARSATVKAVDAELNADWPAEPPRLRGRWLRPRVPPGPRRTR
ncbi:hypothetical protein SBRY_30835 [Actinacidiphila bryophytorum]|uniref:Uncharacterized protein n=1 Tax=Actinacidiphila bryophytorum TaxID=1436133 RepID=A0A9W4H1P4_9ACTN|nr:hypothetical protein SBRY_30835 [Actinacidiphila bryophytorum]